MMKIEGEYTLYGLLNLDQVIDNIIQEIKLEKQAFDIRLILTEAINNAFIHGNKKDISKAIHIRYKIDEIKIIMEIQDEGKGFEHIIIPDAIPEKDLLKESGRGLFIINSLSNDVEIIKNRLIVKKKISTND